MQVRFGYGEEQLLRVLDRAARVLTREREVADLVRGTDEPAEQRGALDDGRVRLGMRHRRHVLHEAHEELRATDDVQLVARRQIGLHALESERLAALPHAFDRGQHQTVRLTRELRRRDAAAERLLVDARVDEDRTEEACLRLGFLRRWLWRVSRDVDRHTGIWSSAALLKNRACSPAKSSWKMPVAPLRFFAMLPWMRRGAPAGVSSLSFHSMRTMSASCSIAPLSRSVDSFGSRPASPAARESCESPTTTTLSSRASDFRLRMIVAISCTRFSSSPPVRMSWM